MNVNLNRIGKEEHEVCCPSTDFDREFIQHVIDGEMTDLFYEYKLVNNGILVWCSMSDVGDDGMITGTISLVLEEAFRTQEPMSLPVSWCLARFPDRYFGFHYLPRIITKEHQVVSPATWLREMLQDHYQLVKACSERETLWGKMLKWKAEREAVAAATATATAEARANGKHPVGDELPWA